MMLVSRVLSGGIAAVCLLLLATGSVRAQGTHFSFTFNGTTTKVTGTLTAQDNRDGSFTATSGTANVQSSTSPGTFPIIANLLAPLPNSTSGGGNTTIFFDDLLFPVATSVIDQFGLAFGTPGSLVVNLFSDPSVPAAPYRVQVVSNGSFLLPTGGESGTFSLQAATPEPAPGTFALIFGLGLIGVLARAKRVARTRLSR